MSANNFLYGNGKDRLLGTSSSIDLNDAETIATSKAVYELNKKIETTGRLPLGHFFLHPFPTPPDGCLVVNGSEYNRELYKDLWADVQIKGQYKTEAEWQSIASANNGYCPWYSDGDGTTTFRTPKFAPYQKIALTSGDAGKYYSEGLPNITGGATNTDYFADISAVLGYQIPEDSALYPRFSTTGSNFALTGSNAGLFGLAFDASRSNPIYGNSEHVTPESHDWIVCAVAFGTATNVGSVDVANVMSAVSQVQANPNLQGVSHLVETWKSEDGTSWYRKYSDGFIEQGGYYYKGSSIQGLVTTTLPTPFSTNTYSFVMFFVHSATDGYSPMGGDYIHNRQTTSVTWNAQANFTGYEWIACGY